MPPPSRFLSHLPLPLPLGAGFGGKPGNAWDAVNARDIAEKMSLIGRAVLGSAVEGGTATGGASAGGRDGGVKLPSRPHKSYRGSPPAPGAPPPRYRGACWIPGGGVPTEGKVLCTWPR